MKRTLEIRPAEGGEDSKLFAKDLAMVYSKFFIQHGWKYQIQESDSCIIIHISGNDLTGMTQEAGGHRIQRIPPTERKGRVHSSTVTVAFLNEMTPEFTLNDSELEIQWYSGTGCGGQNRNKVQNSCRIIHKPTGIIKTAQTRNRESSLKEAKASIIAALKNNHDKVNANELSSIRKNQVGLGERGDKIRTYRFRDDLACDHRNGKKISLKEFMKGNISLLWN